MYARIVLLHLLTSFLFLIFGFLMNLFFGDGAGDFLLFFVVALINFPGVKTIGFLLNNSLNVVAFYSLSILATSVYFILLLHVFCWLRLLVLKIIK